jgi:hypothetical protein
VLSSLPANTTVIAARQIPIRYICREENACRCCLPQACTTERISSKEMRVDAMKRRTRSAIVAKAQIGPDSLKPLPKRFTGKSLGPSFPSHLKLDGTRRQKPSPGVIHRANVPPYTACACNRATQQMTILPVESITRRTLQALDFLPLIARNNAAANGTLIPTPSTSTSQRTPT